MIHPLLGDFKQVFPTESPFASTLSLVMMLKRTSFLRKDNINKGKFQL